MSSRSLAVPTTAALSHTQRISASDPDASRALYRLSRQSLIKLVLEWLDKKNRDYCTPYLAKSGEEEEEDDAPYTAATSLEQVREAYDGLKARKGGKAEVVERIIKGDWRHGLTLYQFAMADTRYLLDHPTSLRWNALKLSPAGRTGGVQSGSEPTVIEDSSNTSLPRFHATTFLLNLQREVAPIAKAHYYITRVKAFGISLLRVHIHDTPYAHTLQTPESKPTSSEGSKSVFFVFPDGSPYVYVSLATNLGQTVGSEGRSLRKVIVDAVPKALSRPQQRYSLTTTSLSTRNLATLLSLRGPGRSNAAPAGWSIFAENSFGHDALDYNSPTTSKPRRKTASTKTPTADADDNETLATGGPVTAHKRTNSTNQPSPSTPTTKRRKQIAASRFGTSALPTDGQGLERLDVRMQDPFPAINNDGNGNGNTTAGPGTGTGAGEDAWTPDVRLSLQGSHVFAGVRQLVEQGVVDGERMPGWMAGEAGVSVGVVREGRIGKAGAGS